MAPSNRDFERFQHLHQCGDSGRSFVRLVELVTIPKRSIAGFAPEKESIIYDLRTLYPGMEYYLEEAYILIVKNPCKYLCDPIYDTLIKSENNGGVNWDTQALMRGEVKNKVARHNLMFSDLGVNYKRLPDYQNGRGTIYNYNFFPQLGELFRCISTFPNGPPVVIECNYYYDVSKTYIGFHGDVERSKVIGIRLGSDFPLHFQWYHKFEKVGYEFSINLSHGDMYMMSSKSVGCDWKSSSKYTLRHAAGHKNVLDKHTKKKK